MFNNSLTLNIFYLFLYQNILQTLLHNKKHSKFSSVITSPSYKKDIEENFSNYVRSKYRLSVRVPKELENHSTSSMMPTFYIFCHAENTDSMSSTIGVWKCKLPPSPTSGALLHGAFHVVKKSGAFHLNNEKALIVVHKYSWRN